MSDQTDKFITSQIDSKTKIDPLKQLKFQAFLCHSLYESDSEMQTTMVVLKRKLKDLLEKTKRKNIKLMCQQQ